MEVSIVEEKENPFLKRKEIVLMANHSGVATPSKAEVLKAIAASNSVDESQIIIDYIFTKKGIPQSFIKAKILKEKPKIEKAKETVNEAQADKAA